MKARPVKNEDTGEIVQYEIKCVGCGHLHAFYTAPFDTQTVWQFNGDINKPTFSPSLLNVWDKPNTGQVVKRCHLFVTDGRVQYLNDCTHSLAGQTIDLPELD